MLFLNRLNSRKSIATVEHIALERKRRFKVTVEIVLFAYLEPF